MLELLYATGMRVSELIDLNVNDINLIVGYVRVFGKGNKERIIPLGTTSMEVLGHYLEHTRPRMLKKK